MKKKPSADAYNITRILLYILLVGIPLRYLRDGFGSGRDMMTCILLFVIAGAIIAVLEFTVFRWWRKKLDTFAAITQGSMYQRTTESYRSANDVNDPENVSDKSKLRRHQ